MRLILVRYGHPDTGDHQSRHLYCPFCSAAGIGRKVTLAQPISTRKTKRYLEYFQNIFLALRDPRRAAGARQAAVGAPRAHGARRRRVRTRRVQASRVLKASEAFGRGRGRSPQAARSEARVRHRKSPRTGRSLVRPSWCNRRSRWCKCTAMLPPDHGDALGHAPCTHPSRTS